MDALTLKAIKTLGIYTAGRFDVWQLAGPARASCRAHVMSELMGRKMPQAKSGVTAIREIFNDRLAISGDCIAVREDAFIAACRAACEPGSGK